MAIHCPTAAAAANPTRCFDNRNFLDFEFQLIYRASGDHVCIVPYASKCSSAFLQTQQCLYMDSQNNNSMSDPDGCGVFLVEWKAEMDVMQQLSRV
jgi:hypothetical protein